jgi:hypothetical protein
MSLVLENRIADNEINLLFFGEVSFVILKPFSTFWRQRSKDPIWLRLSLRVIGHTGTRENLWRVNSKTGRYSRIVV